MSEALKPGVTTSTMTPSSGRSPEQNGGLHRSTVNLASTSYRREILATFLAACLLCLASQAQAVNSRSRSTSTSTSYGGMAPRRFQGYVEHVHGRALLQTTATTSASTFKYRPLAPRSDRIDPLDDFNKYRNGYDIKSKHYWASVVFTGIYGYAIAAGWLALGLLLLLFACCNCLCGSSEHSKRPRSRGFYWCPRIIVFLLSAIAVASSVILLVAARRLNSQVHNVEHVLLEAAGNATTTIHNVSSTLSNVKTVVAPYNQGLYATLDSTQVKLDGLAVIVSDKAFVKYKKTYQLVFTIVDIVLIVVTSLNLLLITLGFASTFLSWRRFFYLIIFLTWVFTALTWVMFGFFFSVHNVADDSCLAFKQYLQDPQNTTLDDLIPCADLASSSTQYLQVRQAMKSVIAQATDQLLYYANGSTSLTGVCDPIGPAPNYKYTGVCANDTLPIGELSNLVEPFVCNQTRTVCLQTYPFYVNQSTYDGIAAISTASQSTLNAFPLMEALTNCSLVLNPIETMVRERCGPAKLAIDRIWLCFAVVSGVMLLLLVFWCLANRRNTQQRYVTSSITPQDQSFPSSAARPPPYSAIPK